MKKPTFIKSVFLSVLCGALVVGCFGIAAADVSVYKTDKFTVDIYGQINRAVLYADDGDSGEFFSVDNDNSSTRFGTKVKAKVNNKLAVGGQLEFEYQSNDSDLVSQKLSNTSDDKLRDRVIEAFVESPLLGKLTLGQGSTASDFSAEVDLSGTKVITYSSIQSFAGGMLFFDNRTHALSTAKISDAFNNMDGLSRADRVRYDTPTFYGFNLSGSIVSENNDDAEDISLWYKGKFPGFKMEGAVSYVNFTASDTKEDQVSGSISFLADFGLNLTLAAGNRQHVASSRSDATYYWGKLGHNAKLFPIGMTAFSVDYGEYDDIRMNKDEAKTIGFGVVQYLKDWNTEVYCGFRHYELDRTTVVPVDYDDIDAAMAGVRIKF